MSEMPGSDRQKRPAEGEPHGWIQWKGTEVCMDFHCKCGAFGHIDGGFIYYVKCGKCGASYMMNGHIELVPITLEEATDVKVREVECDDDEE
jgi:hypothetical protein